MGRAPRGSKRLRSNARYGAEPETEQACRLLDRSPAVESYSIGPQRASGHALPAGAARVIGTPLETVHVRVYTTGGYQPVFVFPGAQQDVIEAARQLAEAFAVELPS